MEYVSVNYKYVIDLLARETALGCKCLILQT